MPCGTTRRSRFFLNSFLRLVAAAGFPGAAVASGTAPFCSFATVHSVSYFAESEILPCMGHGVPCPYKLLALLAGYLFLGCDGAAARTLAGACVGVRALAAHRQVAPVTDAAIGLD